MTRRALLVGVTAWLLVAVLGSSLVWAVISRAGDRVASGGGPLVASGGGLGDGTVSEDGVVPDADRPGPGPDRPGRSGRDGGDGAADIGGGDGGSAGSSAASPSSTTGASPGAAAGPDGGSAGGSAGGSGGGRAGGSSTGGASGPSSAPAAPRTVRATWTGPGGSVVAECTGAEIRLVGAQPDAGFTVEVGRRGPDRVEVDFEGQGEEDRESRVTGTCSGGEPRFSADVDTVEDEEADSGEGSTEDD